MSRDFDELLHAWVDEGEDYLPDVYLDAALLRAAGLPQRRAPAIALRRFFPMRATTGLFDRPIMRIGAIAAAAVVTVMAVAIVLGSLPGPDVGGPGLVPDAPTSSPSVGPTAAAASEPCATNDPLCRGPLTPGRHTSDQLLTAVSFEVPAGWSKTLDVSGSFNLESDGHPEALIAILPDWAIADQSSCTSDAEPGQERTVEALVSFLTAHPGLVVTEPVDTTIGGLDGVVLDVSPRTGWEGPCEGEVSLFTHDGTIGDVGWWLIPDEARMRLYLLDAGGGRTVTIHVETAASEGFEAFVDAAAPIVESFDFTP